MNNALGTLAGADIHADAFLRTGIRACSAPDTFRRDGDLFRSKVQRTGFLTCHAGSAVFFFPADLHQAETVEPAIDGAQGAQILTERPADHD